MEVNATDLLVSNHTDLPNSICIEPTTPAVDYTENAEYISDNPSIQESTNLLDTAPTVQIDHVSYRVFAFRPNGTALTSYGLFQKSHLLLVPTLETTAIQFTDPDNPPKIDYTQLSSTGTGPSNWAHLSVDLLTG